MRLAAAAIAAALALLLPLPLPGRRLPSGLHGLAEEVRRQVQENYVEPVDPLDLTWRALKGMVALDHNSVFMTPREAASFDEEARGEFEGIGVYVELIDGLLRVTSPLEGSPAAVAGILPGDWILAADGHSLQGLVSAEAGTRQIKGPAGTSVELLVQHEGADEPVTITVVRGAIQVDSVRDARIIPDPTGAVPLAYLRITQFQPSTVDEFDRALEGLMAQHPAGLVLDLRFNPGGLLGWNRPPYPGAPEWSGGVGVADRLVAEGVLVRVRGRDPAGEQLYSARPDGTRLPDVPVAVLMDGSSASASEIVAGAVRDTGRGVLVGSRSYGKGSVQTVIPVPLAQDGRPEEAQLKLTTARYYTASGRNIHREQDMDQADEWGLLPDLRVDLEPEERNAILAARRPGEAAPPESAQVPDRVLDAAVGLLRDAARYGELLAVPPRRGGEPEDER